MRRILLGLLLLAGSLGLLGAVVAQPKPGTSFVNDRTHEAEVLAADLPAELHMWNIRSRRDGAGMCVMTSVEMAALYAGLDEMKGLRDWCANEAGGASAGKVDDQLKRFCAARKIPCPAYIQYEGSDPGPVLEALDRAGLMACHTYGYSPRYRGTIYHMVDGPTHGGKYGVVMDNNAIGGVSKEHLYEWMERAEQIKRIKHPGGRAWVFAWVTAPPPPPPKN